MEEEAFPTFLAPPLDHWVNDGRASNMSCSSIGFLGQWWEHFQHSLLLCWVLGSTMREFPICPAPLLSLWVNGQSISSTPCFSIGSLDQCERASNVPYSSTGFLGQWWEHFQHSLLLRWVLGSMMREFPICPAPLLSLWVNGGRAFPASPSSPLGPWINVRELPTCPTPPLGPWVNGGSISSTPCSSVGSLGQWWEHFQHSLLLH